MAKPSPTRRDLRQVALVAGFALMAAASSIAWADACEAIGDEAPAEQPADEGEKFSLITGLCPALAAPVRVRRAEQLGLFDRSASVTIDLAGPALPAVAMAATAAAAPRRNEPLGAAALRVVALAPALLAAARAEAIDPLLLHAVAHVESRHNPQAVSPVGARGVMQMMPATAQRFGVADPERKLFDADTNLRAGAAYLHTLSARYGDDLRLVLAAYNAGEGAVAKHGNNVPPYPETQAYVRDVLAVYRKLTTKFSVSPSGALVTKGDPS